MPMTVARCRFRNESSDSIEFTPPWFSCLKMFMNLLIRANKHELIIILKRRFNYNETIEKY